MVFTELNVIMQDWLMDFTSITHDVGKVMYLPIRTLVVTYKYIGRYILYPDGYESNESSKR
jgi:hypothetical protein